MNATPVPIRESDKLQTLFERDERLIDVVASHSPQLAKLRNSPMRRIMARVTTVAQVAKLCKMPVESLVRDLNHVLGIDTETQDGAVAAPHSDVDNETEPSAPLPAFAHVVDLDVRDELSKGGEPFSRIMAAVASLGDGDALHLRAPFQPVPLFGVMEKRGFAHRVVQHADDDWSVWFFRQAESPASQPERARPAPAPVERSETHSDAGTNDSDGRPELWLDVRDMEPPEPLVHTLEALETLPPGNVLVQQNMRVPQFLLPILRERGFHFTIDESQPNEVQVRIWRND